MVDLEVPGLVDAVGDSVESCHLCRTALLRETIGHRRIDHQFLLNLPFRKEGALQLQVVHK